MKLWMRENEKVRQYAGDEMVIILSNWSTKLQRYRRYRACLLATLVISCAALFTLLYYQMDSSIPSTLYVRADQEDSLQLNIPAKAEIVSVGSQGESNIPQGAVTIDLSEPVALKMDSSETYQMQVKLFGFLPFKEVDICPVTATELVPVGIPIGIYLKADGILVIGVGEFNGADGGKHSPSKNILRSGDYIRKLNGESIDDKELFIQRITESNGEEVMLTVEREDKLLELQVTPVQDEGGQYRIGVWVRDNAQGVGTMTYMDEEGNFGALGHGINDVDTSTLMELDDGTLYQTEIISIHKGAVGRPGEMVGMIVYSNERILGDITGNNPKGIFGKCNTRGKELAIGESLPIGLKQEIEKGPAQIVCAVDGKRRYYDVEITGVRMDNNNVNRGIELTVTDPELLKITGGIIQGMSGAPIIQNGKFVGAVTHVLVSDPTKGYGIFIETMLAQN
ncbi:MAG: SpoIVB peptidase [Lachnospiraceae bacterium]|nr:SpoIVB peptidase [Lachnospiraceae bacterium]